MFSYIRWFSIISFVLVVIAALFFGHEFRDIASEDLFALVENYNESLVKGFQNTTWKYQQEKLNAALEWYKRFRSSGVPVNQWKNYNGYKEMVDALDNFSRAVFKHFEDMPIVEFDIYTPDGLQVVAVKQSGQGLQQGGGTSLFGPSPPQVLHTDGVFDKVLSTGKSASIPLMDQPFVKPDGKSDKGVLIKSMIPLMKSGCKEATGKDVSCVSFVPELVSTDMAKSREAIRQATDAIIEVRYDVTSQWKNLDRFQAIGIGGVIGIYVVVVLILLYTSARAEIIIAKQHEANVELAAQAAAAQAENRDKSQFLANVSHELRTPLNAIIGFSEFIKSERSGPIGNEKYGEYIKDIHGSGVHLLSLINDILDYSKAEADKLELEISEVDATKAVKNCMRLVSPRAEVAQVQLVEEIPREHFIMKTDAKKLKQIMLNLLSNAVKFTPAGGSVKVSMWQNVVEEGVAIEVKDTGIGIAPKDISRAMAPFGQVDNTLSRKYEGTGLGLPLTRKFVEIMGGTFNIASEVGKGTTITITLPKESKGKAAAAQSEGEGETVIVATEPKAASATESNA